MSVTSSPMRCHSSLLLLLLMSLLLTTGCRERLTWSGVDVLIRSQHPTVNEIPTDSLAALLQAGLSPVLIDVREEAEFRVSHLPGAVHMAPGEVDFAFFDSLDLDQQIVTYCSVGLRSAALAERLAEAGFSNVFNLKGSIFRWANEERPLFQGPDPAHQVHPYDRLWGTLLRKDLRSYDP
jgi:rhodanese-related sulfurtransferase